jgi:shikimate kinase
MIRPRVVLVGLPATGKTTVGKSVAARLGVDFADTDDMIVEMTGRAIGEIFAHDGEAAFRELEAAAIADALLDFDGVLALGGGAVTTESVRESLVDAGVPVVLLTADQDELLARVGNTTQRPLLAGDTDARLAVLRATREPLYRQVTTGTVHTDGRSVDEVADDIVGQIAGESA